MIFETISKAFQVNSVNLHNMTLSGIQKLQRGHSIESAENLEYKNKIEKSPS